MAIMNAIRIWAAYFACSAYMIWASGCLHSSSTSPKEDTVASTSSEEGASTSTSSEEAASTSNERQTAGNRASPSSPSESIPKTQSLPFQQVDEHFIPSGAMHIVRTQDEWDDWLATGPFFIFQLQNGQPVLPSPPCAFDEHMLIVFRLPDHTGCAPPTITVTDVSLMDGTMVVAYRATSNEKVSFSPDGLILTCPANWVVTFSVCVPAFEGPIEAVFTGIGGDGHPLLLDWLEAH